MPKITVIKPFKFAHGGIRVEEFEPSKEPHETTDECAEIAIAEGWAKLAAAPSKKKQGGPEVPAREQLDEALADLPGSHTDPEYVVGAMRNHFGELFTEADEAKVRELVKKPD